jgi:serine/threonine protein kinase
MHAEKILNLSKCSSFPKIYEKYSLQIEGHHFLVILEEFLPHPFSLGVLNVYEEKDKDIVKCVSAVLLELLKLYTNASTYGFVSHRDLSFDNIMFDEEYNLKMIDLGSAKSTEAETTVFHIAAPTKKFYSAPEYEDMHISRDKTNVELVKAEIYTIGLLMLSLLVSLEERLFEKNIPSQCGIVYWGRSNGRITDVNVRLSEVNKRDYTNYVLINIFNGDEKNILYKLLKGMTDKSVSARIPNYEFIINVLEREVQ